MINSDESIIDMRPDVNNRYLIGLCVLTILGIVLQFWEYSRYSILEPAPDDLGLIFSSIMVLISIMF